MSLPKCIAFLVLGALFASAAFPSLAAAAWPHDKSGVTVQPYSASARVCADGAGGTFVAFNLYSFTSSSYDLYLQRFNAAGVAMYAAPGVLVCEAAGSQYPEAIFSDTYGGCIVVWQDYRTGQNDYYAQRVESGVSQWALDGIPICAAAGSQTALKVESNGGLLWFVWTDPRNAGTTGNDIYAQAITLYTGSPYFPANGQVVCNAAGEQSAPDFAADVNGYAHIVWQDARSGASDIYIQILGYSGFSSYVANGVAVCDAVGQQVEPQISLAGSNRYFVSWSDLRGADFDIYAASFSSFSISPFWAANGVVVCNVSGTQYLNETLMDAAGNLVLLWSDQRRGSATADLYAQKLDHAGAAQWGSGGVPIRVANGAVGYVRAAPDGQGGTLVVWQDSRTDLSDVYAQRIASWGSPLWTANGAVVGSGPSSQANAGLVPTGDGGAFVAWDDYYNAPWGCRLQKLDEWGYAGADPILASVKDIPNDQGGQVKVSWYGSPLDTDPAYRNISDYVVYRSVPTALAAQLARAAASAGMAAEDGGVSLNGKRYLRTTYAAQSYFWEELAHVTPRHLSTYSYVAATEGDSMGGSNKKTAFMVMAIANYGASWWTSNADSGYSVDNVAPAAPAPLTGQYAASGTTLHWDPNTEPDLAGYRVYRGSSASFTPSPATLVAAVADTGYVAAGSTPYFYKLTAVDIHGNESPVATLMPSGTLAVDGGAARAKFAAPAPNPLRGGAASTLRFALAVGGRAKLALYDAQGRVARVLVDGALEAGEHAVTLRGDGLAPGLYLARLESPGFTATRRVMVVE